MLSTIWTAGAGSCCGGLWLGGGRRWKGVLGVGLGAPFFVCPNEICYDAFKSIEMVSISWKCTGRERHFGGGFCCGFGVATLYREIDQS